MTPTILITGAGPNGITGRRIKDKLGNKYNILVPSSKELNLLNEEQIENFFLGNKVDYIIHSAVQTPSRGYDKNTKVENNLRMFYNLVRYRDIFQKMFYLGSGAEYNKSFPIEDVKECDEPKRILLDSYGFVKYVVNQFSLHTETIFNLRLFGTINPYEPYNKNVISNLCAKAILGLPLNLNRNCIFSFVDIDDVGSFIDKGINKDLLYHDYNMCGWTGSLGNLAEIVREISDKDLEITFNEKGYGNQYTGNCDRIKNENFVPTPIKDSISKVYNYWLEREDTIDELLLNARWNVSSK